MLVSSSHSLVPSASVFPSAQGAVALTSLSGCGTLGESGVAVARGPAGGSRASSCLQLAGLGVRAPVGGACWATRPAVLFRADVTGPALAFASRQLGAEEALPPPHLLGPRFLPSPSPQPPEYPLNPRMVRSTATSNVYSASPDPSLSVTLPPPPFLAP